MTRDSSGGRMSLRSSCKGDCDLVKSGAVRRGHHHHHHHHTQPKAQQSAVQLTNSARSSVTRTQSSIEKTVKTSSSITSNVLSSSSRTAKKSDTTTTTTPATVNVSSLFFETPARDRAYQPVKVASKVSETKVVTSGGQSGIWTADQRFGEQSMSWLPSYSEQTAPALDWNEKKTLSSVTTRSVQRSRKQYSDYSSGEEDYLDTPAKTDYTYARSSSYSSRESASREVPTPNMSRRELHGFTGISSTPYNVITTEKQTSASNATSTALGVSAIMVASPSGAAAFGNTFSDGSKKFSSRRYSTNTARLSYGLDYESDEDLQQATNHYYQRYNTKIVTTTSIITTIFDYAAAPFRTFFNTVWMVVYWVISFMQVVDTWILSSKLGKLWWILFLLCLLPLLLLGSLFILDEAESPISSLISSISFPALSSLPILPYFAIFGNNTSSNTYLMPSVPTVPPVVISTATSSCPDNSENQLAIANLKEMILNIHQTQKDQLNRAQVEDVIRSVVNQEMLKFTSAASLSQADVNIQANSLSEHSTQLADLQAQMQLILTQSQTLADELKNTKEKILEERRSNHKDSLKRLEGLEIDLDSLKDNIRHIQETQVMLLANMRNCCRNHTYDPTLVENQVAAILMQIMGKSPPSGGEGRSEFVTFTDWLKMSFVAQSDLEGKLSSSAAHMSHVLSEDVSAKAAAAAKLAAAAAVQASLSEHRFSANLSQNKSVTLNEDDIRKIVRDALTIYDADKTGKPDFALESAGGSVISTRCSETYHSRTGQLSLLGIPLWFTSNTPRVAIQPGVQPGECWAFKGSEGYLVIQLSGWVQPTAFSIEHISRALAPSHSNLDSAPKDFSVYGLKSDKNLDSTFIGRYSYSIDGEPLQYFAVADPNIDSFPIVELRIHSNHGNLEYTCLYRFRVHGNLLKNS